MSLMLNAFFGEAVLPAHTIDQLIPSRLAISKIGRRSADSRMICPR
jgi:hypothetical protein